MPERRGLQKATGSMEGFYRSIVAPVQHRPLPPRQAIAPAPVSAPIPATIVRTSKSMEVSDEIENEKKPAKKEKVSPGEPTKRSDLRPAISRQRSSIILESAFASKAGKSSTIGPELPSDADPSMVCTAAYRGMEVVFATARNPYPVVYCLCSRTRVILQTLDLPTKNATIVSLLCNPANGMVTIALSDGSVQTYHPIPTNSKLSSDPNEVVSAFGMFRWVNGPMIACREIFYGQNHEQVDVFCHETRMSGPGECVSISSSADFKVLVSHRDQLAVFNAPPLDTDAEVENLGTSVTRDFARAELLWTVRLERHIETAKLSGDGRAIALVVEGEGLENENPFGVRTFIRDSEDGSTLRSEILEPKVTKGVSKPGALNRSTSSSRSLGIVFKPGPFLVHSASVTTVSFRGFGQNVSAVCPDETEGNDLLLTYCMNGSSIRIFSQNSWKVLTEWSAPPNTRVDWVRGLSAFNLGDLEATKKRKTSGSAPVSRRPSFNSLTDASAGINAALLGKRPPTYQGPNTAAGAWIVEVTFRNNFPALRLSRLSYMKRGGDEMQPAHFESVAAILPHSSLNAASVLCMGDCGLSVQGIWPAWNPWRSDSSAEEAEGTLSGSAMAFLGLSSMSTSPAGFFGENYQAGTHSPPSELRVVASHPSTGKVVLMEFPLWGDDDFGAMELGSPLRYEFSLSEVDGGEITSDDTMKIPKGSGDEPLPEDTAQARVSLVYESSIICGRIVSQGKTISLTWRKEGSMSVLPASMKSGRRDSLVSVSSSCSVDSTCSPSSLVAHPDSDEVEIFKDVSVVPAPLSLPQLTLSPIEHLAGDEVLVAAKWWTDVAYGGPPMLLSVTSKGTILVHELSPPWSVLEPPMPSDDLFVASAASSSVGGGETSSYGGDSDDEGPMNGDYEVMLTPDPDFGIGLRLEAQIDGMPAIAGSYKKHPLNRGTLPAENTGMIVLGDELVSINGISLEGISFDEIIATVRQVGTDAHTGSPICMKFRPSKENRRRINTANSAFSFTESQHSEANRRTMEQILGVNRNQSRGNSPGKADEGLPRATSLSSVSKVTTELNMGDSSCDNESEMGQQFHRVVALVQGALPSSESLKGSDYQSCVALLPWIDDGDTSSSSTACIVALLIVAEGSRLHSRRLEHVIDDDPHKSSCRDLGSIDFSDESNSEAGGDRIRMIEVVPNDTECWCIAVHHDNGMVRLTFLELHQSGGDQLSAADLRVSYRHYSIFQVDTTSGTCSIRASSVELLATLSSSNGKADEVTVWSSRPSPASVGGSQGSDESKGDESSHDYAKTLLLLDGDTVVDMMFVPGCLDAFPHIVTMTETAATVHRRDGGSLKWRPVVRLMYASLPRSEQCAEVLENGDRVRRTLCPADTFPHLIPTLRSLISVSDERHYLRSDWHPDAILAYACSAAQGTKTSLRHNVKGIFKWLSQWLDSSEEARPTIDAKFPLVVTPLREFDGHDLLMPSDETADDDAIKDTSTAQSWSLIPSTSEVVHPKNKEDRLLDELQRILCPSRRSPIFSNSEDKSNEGSNDMDRLPQPIAKLSPDELRLLWAIGELLSDFPSFKGLDPAGQLTLFAMSLMRRLERATDEAESEAKESKTEIISFLVKRPLPTFQADKKEFVPVASAGCLSALTSSSQGRLLEACRLPVPNDKFDWKSARSLRLPFWIRSDTLLRAICEEIGQATFKETRNVLDCALFFIASGNMRRLRNFAATDQSTSGRTFLKFITDQDFSSPRGRKAAEKNAYSLLRKKQYQRAASFFLLAQPPMLKTSLEIIVTQMEDLDLAFLVARVMGSNPQHDSAAQLGGLGGIGSPGTMLGGMMGMGGGYASASDATTMSADETTFADWSPSLSRGAKTLLLERGLSVASQDPCLKAVQLVWLGKREEASTCLSGLSQGSGENDTALASDALFPRAFDLRLDPAPDEFNKARHPLPFPSASSPSPASANDRVLKKANSVINFISCPFLVKSLNASARSRWASTLLVSRALMRRGIDLASVRILLQNTDELDLDDNAKKDSNIAVMSETVGSNGTVRHPVQQHSKDMTSSIFDVFDSPGPKKSQAADMSSSIFDSFDAVPAKPTQKSPVASNSMESSIFDGFDTKPPKKQVSPAVPAQPAASSIFDSFDTVPQPKPVTTNDPMSSSIFDALDAPLPKKKVTLAPTAPASSSIFDSFDVPSSAKSKINSRDAVSQSEMMTSSIFDSFENRPPGASSTDTLQQGSVGTNNVQGCVAQDDTEDDVQDVVSLPLPKLWGEWRRHMLLQSAARRLLREIATIMSRFHSDALDTPIKLFRRHVHPLVPFGAGEVLHQRCDGHLLLENMKRSLEDICALCNLDRITVVDQALRVLSCPSRQVRVVYAALLHILVDRTDRVEEVVRDAALGQIQHCEAIARSNDQLVDNRKTSHHMASQYLRRLSARVSWQLEICLWLNRGGLLILSGRTVKEATIAVRTGLLVSSWGRCHTCLEAMVQNAPDVPMDEEAGAQLWSSMKLIVGPEDQRKSSVVGVGSGGWEFLVDCRRSEATEMLRNKPPGTFIIRPHPEDTGVFTLSFKTNLVPTEESHDSGGGDVNRDKDEINAKGESTPQTSSTESGRPKASTVRPVKKDDVVQHAIIRLSDAGFRCGSFGPFATLLQLLEGVSGSLPFDLLFNKPPSQGIIKDEGTQPSPNAVFLRKLALVLHSNNQYPEGVVDQVIKESTQNSTELGRTVPEMESSPSDIASRKDEKAKAEQARRKAFGMFLQLSVLSDIRKQLCAIAEAKCEHSEESSVLFTSLTTTSSPDDEVDDKNSVDSVSVDVGPVGVEESYAVASRIVRPLLNWCRLLETGIVYEVAPSTSQVAQAAAAVPVELAASDTAIELAPQDVGCAIHGGDAVIRLMIQPESGVEFRTLRVGEGSDSAMIVLFSKDAAKNWLISSGAEKDEDDALARMQRMERRRVIEPIAMADLAIKAFASNVDQREEQDQVRYRFVDPWEVEVLESRAAETMAASLGRERYYEFNVGTVAESCENIFRKMGGVQLLSLWTYVKGGLRLTKAAASVYAPWERDAGGDLQMTDGVVSEPSSFLNSIREHLYRNALFRLLKMPQRFLSLVQVELLDLKNLTSPGGSSSLTVFALVRLKRSGSSARLTNKAKTLDTATTPPTKIGKTSGPNAAASWGSVVRFRFPLPEDVNCDGVSSDADRESLFKGPPTVLQVSVYEKKFMSDIFLGSADIDLDALTGGGQLEEWVPLRASKQGIHWFARIRLTLRFELMCLGSDQPSDLEGELPPSVGLQKIKQLSEKGGAVEDSKVKKSASTSDLLSYFDSMLH